VSGALRLGAALACLAAPAAAAPADAPLRIEALGRCGELLAPGPYEVCVRASGLAAGPVEVRLGGARVAGLAAAGPELRIAIDPKRHASGPLALAQGARRSNGVWLSLRPAAVVAARPDEVARNDDGIPSYVNLVSVIVEEEYDALAECRRIAAKYRAEIVGGIPALALYQLRLPTATLLERDALVLRIGSEERVDAVVTEESRGEEDEAAEEPAGPPPVPTPAGPPPVPGAAGPPPVPASVADERIANRFADAVDAYRRRVPGAGERRLSPTPIRVGVIERSVDFDAPDFAEAKDAPPGALRLYARDARRPSGHGTTLAGILAARWGDGGNTGFLRGLDGHAEGLEVIVDRGSDAGITANVAASVNLVEDGARVLNWSFGLHRVGARRADGGDLDTMMRSGIAIEGYEELFDSFFSWLRREHPDVLVVNSAGNAAADSSEDDYRLPSSFVSEQLLVVGAHERSGADVPVEDPRFAKRRATSNLGRRIDVTAAACVESSPAAAGAAPQVHCGTSYATALVTGLAAAMLSIDPALSPRDVRTLLRRSALPIGEEFDFEPVDAEDLTDPIVPSERGYEMDHPDVGRGARVDMRKAIELAIDSRERRDREAKR
jgi:subtilisin family serine protease